MNKDMFLNRYLKKMIGNMLSLLNYLNWYKVQLMGKMSASLHMGKLAQEKLTLCLVLKKKVEQCRNYMKKEEQLQEVLS